MLMRRKLRIETERLTLRPPQHADFNPWTSLRQQSEAYLPPWEPTWAEDHLSRRAFTNRVYWAHRSVSSGSALPMFLLGSGSLFGPGFRTPARSIRHPDPDRGDFRGETLR